LILPKSYDLRICLSTAQLEDSHSKYQEWVNTFKLDGRNQLIVPSTVLFSAFAIRKKSRTKFIKNELVVCLSLVTQVIVKTQGTTKLRELEISMHSWNKMLSQCKSGNGKNILMSDIPQNLYQFIERCIDFITNEL